LADRRANQPLQIQACLQLARIEAAGNALQAARDRLIALRLHWPNPAYLQDIQNEQAWLSIRTGDFSALEEWSKAPPAQTQLSMLLQQETRAFLLARHHIARGCPQEALALLDAWEQDSAQNGRLRSQVLAPSLKALAERGAPTKAAQALTQALALAQPKGFKRIFLDEGARMADLLQVYLSEPANRSARVYAATLLHLFPAEAQENSRIPAVAYRMEPLSQQELRVLRLLAAGLSNPEIARELVVSTNTIKTQVKSIYHKLNVRSRAQAREVAHALNLLG
jgi:LuxR family maltose regulon positive regulatory protein